MSPLFVTIIPPPPPNLTYNLKILGSYKLTVYIFLLYSLLAVSPLPVAIILPPPHTMSKYTSGLTPKWQKNPAGTRQTEGEDLVWFGEKVRKLAKLSMTTFTYRSSS